MDLKDIVKHMLVGFTRSPYQVLVKQKKLYQLRGRTACRDHPCNLASTHSVRPRSEHWFRIGH